ncbi:MAG: hypothetical protein R6W90_17775 [Ignavibacteriaceae bacterium]
MKKFIPVLIVLFLSSSMPAQVSIRGGMGIQFQSMPSFRDHLNRFSDETAGEFSSAVTFSVEGGYMVTEKTELALEVAYLFNSYNFNYSQFEVSYGIIMPSVIYSYVLRGMGYSFKFGGGAGIRLVNFRQKVSSEPDDYTSTGFGFLLRFDGNTSIGGNFYANIGADLRYDFNGEPENSSGPVYNPIFSENVNLNSFSAGIRIGISYQF